MQPQQAPTPSRIITLPFVLMLSGAMLFFGSMFFLLPTLPLYAVSLGARPVDIGLITGSFTVTAVIARPLAGSISDRIGRKPILLAGSVVFATAPLLYLLADSVPALVGMRLYHGTGIALYTVASFSLVAEMIPAHRRGEGMGIYGIASLVGMSAAPPLAVPLLDRVGFAGVFAVAGASAAGSALLGWAIAERRHRWRHLGAPSFLAVARSRWLLVASGALISGAVTYGCVLSFLPLFVVERDLGNVGLFFSAYAISTMVTRIPIGRFADAIGLRRVVSPTLLVLAGTMILLSQVQSTTALLVVAAIYGVSFGTMLPLITALVVERAPEAARGQALGVSTGAFDLGIGAGSVALGVVAAATDFATMFIVAGVICLAGAALFRLYGAPAAGMPTK